MWIINSKLKWISILASNLLVKLRTRPWWHNPHWSDLSQSLPIIVVAGWSCCLCWHCLLVAGAALAGCCCCRRLELFAAGVRHTWSCCQRWRLAGGPRQLLVLAWLLAVAATFTFLAGCLERREEEQQRERRERRRGEGRVREEATASWWWRFSPETDGKEREREAAAREGERREILLY